MRVIYICERPYNLFRTLLKAVNSNDEMDIMITDNVKGMELMCDELRHCGLFKNVFFFNELKHKTFDYPLRSHNTFGVKSFADFRYVISCIFSIIKGFFNYLRSQRQAKHIKLPHGLDFTKYDEIHLTDCTSIINFYLYHKKFTNLIYVEHGKDALSGHYPRVTDYLTVFVKLRIIYGVRGSCRYIKAIEVNKNENLIKDTRGKEIREIPLDDLIDVLSSEQKDFIYRIYAKSYNFDFSGNSVIDVFLTTSTIWDVPIDLFIPLCRDMIEQHMLDADYIIIKPHPSDSTDYSEIPKLYPNVVLVPASFSAEIFTFNSSLKIRKLINIISTATNMFKSVDEVITLDRDFIADYKG